MDNPVASLLRAAGMSQADFAKRFDYSKGAVIYLLAGTYNEISERMLNDLRTVGQEKSLDVAELATRYRIWQQGERRKNADHLGRAHIPFRFDENTSPAHNFMVDTFGSREGFAKGMKLSPATLDRWERGLTKGLPLALELALAEVKYTHVRTLQETQTAWVAEYVT